MPNQQLARGLWAQFATQENPFGVANGMEENLRHIDDHLALYTLLPPQAPGTPLPAGAIDGDGQAYTDGSYATFNGGTWRTYAPRNGVRVVLASGTESWLNTGVGWAQFSVVDTGPAVAAALAAAIGTAEAEITPLVQQAEAEAQSAASAVDAAFAEATAAQSARTGAEAARDAALIQAGVFVDEPTGRAAVLDGQAFKVQGAGDVAAYEYRRVSASSSTLVATYPSIQAYNNAVSNSFAPANFSYTEAACVKCIEQVEVIRFTGFTNDISLLKLATNSSGKPTEVNFFYFSGSNQFIICAKASEDLINGYETWVGENNSVRVSARVNVKKTPVSFIYYDAAFSTNNMRVQQYFDAAERKSVLFSELYRQYVEFTEVGVYDASGNVTTAYGGYHKALDINKTGFYQIGWTLAGNIRCMHALNAAGAILASWNGGYFANARDKTIDVPAGATRLLLSSYSDAPFNSSNPKDGFLIHTPKAAGATYGLVSEDQINGLIEDARTDDAPYIEIYGNMWTDGAWRNTHDTNSIARVYPLISGETYEILYAPTSSLVAVPEQTISSKSITSQLAALESFTPISHNGALFNNLGDDCDSVTVNGYTRKGYIAATWTPPAGAKSLIVQVQYGAGNALPGIRLFKRKGAKGPYVKNNNANKRIAVCGDSVAAYPGADIGKERLRDSLGCVVHTYAVPGAGFAYNATPTWTTPNLVSGVMQVEELVKAATPAYDIYCLSGTLNDPVTHNKAIGSITHCRPYLKVGGLPDFSDPNLDTMLGALNFCIQRIYEKNPKAKIVISTMGKIFLTTPRSGFGLAAGYNINDTTTNSSGSTYYQYVQALRLLGESWGIPVADVYAKAGINEYNKGETMTDAYHPNLRGYEGI